MKKLVCNTNSVDDGYGDKSFGYDEGYEKDFLIYKDELKEDVNLIVEAYKDKGYDVERKYAYYVWDEYSQSLSASWLYLGSPSDKRNDWIIRETRKFLVEEKGEICQR